MGSAETFITTMSQFNVTCCLILLSSLPHKGCSWVSSPVTLCSQISIWVCRHSQLDTMFNTHKTRNTYYSYPHLTGEDTETQKGLSNLPKVIQLLSNESRERTEACYSGFWGHPLNRLAMLTPLVYISSCLPTYLGQSNLILKEKGKQIFPLSSFKGKFWRPEDKP